MKIGIVTQPLIANYGGFLQAWALQEILRKMGHSPVTIDYIPQRCSWYIYVLSWCKTIIYYFMGKPRSFIGPLKRGRFFEEFVKKNISITDRQSCYNNKIIKKYGFEVIVTGSDQVWRPMYNVHIQDMYLRFVKEANVKKLAYAASFGVDNWEYTPEQTKSCAQLANKFVAISVREKSAVDLCGNYLGVDAIEVLDPTLLHSAGDYEKLCIDIPKATEPFLASYVLDYTPEKQVVIDNIAKRYGLNVRFFSAHEDASLSVEEWLAYFRDAEYVVTDSFHGCVFSIIFNKPFIAMTNKGRGETRFLSLLSMLGLGNRLLTSVSAIDKIRQPINWVYVSKKINNLKESSIYFLKQNLI